MPVNGSTRSFIHLTVTGVLVLASMVSDGFPEAWWLPNAIDIPAGYVVKGKRFSTEDPNVEAGAALYKYNNDQRPTTLWFHDHSLGMTRTNVYAGPAGFYLLRGTSGIDDLKSGGPGGLPTGAYEIPLVIQDKSFNDDGSLFYPATREFFDGFAGPYVGDPSTPSDISPLWNPEFFGNTMVVNGKTWPFLNVERRKYRFRILNASDSRFLVLAFNDKFANFTVIGTDGGYLPAPVVVNQLLVGPAERFDVIVDFSRFKAGTRLLLQNLGPDSPFGGFPILAADLADPVTTGKVMQFNVVALTAPDTSAIPKKGQLGALFKSLAAPIATPIQVSLNELESAAVCVDANNVATPCTGDPTVDVKIAPLAAQLGTMTNDPAMGGLAPMAMPWMMPVTENPILGAVQTWELYNFTMDAHPIHLHQTMFQVVNREPLVMDPVTGMAVMPVQLAGGVRPPEVWESGFKDTVIAYPGEVTRIKAYFDIAGLYVWHCHILSHEDNEMMRPLCAGGNCP